MGTGATERPGRAGPLDAAGESLLGTHRLLSLLGTLSLFGVAFASWSATVQVPASGAVAALVFGVGLVLAAATIAAPNQRVLERLDVVLVGLALLALAAWATEALYHNPGYGTDEAAYEQAAAELLLHGHDPYGVSLLPALSRFRVPIQFATYTMGGGVVSQLGYPALPVLIVAGFVKLTGGTQAVPIANVVALMMSALMLFRLLPRQARALAALVPVGLPILFGYAVAGVNAIIVMACLLPLAYRWTEVGTTGRLTGRQRWQAIALGLALATQQLAWFIAPFLLSGIYLMRRPHLGRRGAAGVLIAYAGLAAATFALVNLPFAIWSPGAWLRGIAAPLTQHAIPYGQGMVDLTLFLHVGGGAIGSYNLAAGALYVGLLTLYVSRFRRLARGCFLLPTIALFVADRSLAEYFMTLVAVVIISVVTVDAHAARAAAELWRPWRHQRLMLAAAFLPATVCLAVALGSPQPLAMRIVEVRTTGQLQSVWRLRVLVHNRSSRLLRPHFATNSIGQATTFWNVVTGPRRLPAHATASYLLAAPNVGSMPGLTSPFLLEAFTVSPQTASSTGLFTPQPYVATLMPSYVDHVLPSGAATTLTVQLDSPLGRPVATPGVRVALGQLIYGQETLIPSEAQINHGQEGATPVFATTGRSGAATFTVRDDFPQGQPIYLQAWVQPASGYPFGYSEIVSVLWR